MKYLIITFIILIFGLLDFLNPLRHVFQQFSSPVQFGLRKSAISLKDSLQLFYNFNRIREDNLDLIKENRDLKGIIANLKNLEEENSLLKNQLDLKNEGLVDKELVLASVMGNSQDLTGTSMMLDKGYRQGIKVGNNVILGNYLVGVITEVTSERSIFNLITSPDVSVTVLNVEPSSQAEGLAKGDLGTSIKVTKLLPGERVEKGDVFISSGKDGRFLPGFAIGEVSQVNFGASDPLKSALLTPMVDFSHLDKVFVILEP